MSVGVGVVGARPGVLMSRLGLVMELRVALGLAAVSGPVAVLGAGPGPAVLGVGLSGLVGGRGGVLGEEGLVGGVGSGGGWMGPKGLRNRGRMGTLIRMRWLGLFCWIS
ncbi:hypothetical protein GCM10009804_08220 [Kribbella hippodromi]|uniref:Uncharacterized protein n=1 Tax=Kribbella hippodromi TaxID=434347 RepID=A0ABP4N0K2_9ACTN